ncbi:hypothetical protein ACVOMV_07405 [Mesorhizobium atlanticum]
MSSPRSVNRNLLLPGRIKGALAANDRLKFALTALQAAAAHATDGAAPLADLRRDYAAAHVNAPWMLEMQEAAWSEGGKLHLPELPRLGKLLGDDIRLMAPRWRAARMPPTWR